MNDFKYFVDRFRKRVFIYILMLLIIIASKYKKKLKIYNFRQAKLDSF
jgi:hypothetical protein